MTLVLQPSVGRMNASAAKLPLHSKNENDYGSKTSQDADTQQQQLATQLPPPPASPARPSSRDSIRSQDEAFVTQSNAMNPLHKMSIAAITEPSPPIVIRDRKSLLLCLAKNKDQKTLSPNDHPEQATADSRRKEINEPTVSDTASFRRENVDQSEAIMSQNQSDDVGLSSLGKTPTVGSSQPQAKSAPVLPTEQPKSTYSEEKHEVTSFQRVPTSPRIDTSPVREAKETVTGNDKTEPNNMNGRPADIHAKMIGSDRSPWGNITKLRWRDVIIPKDQEELLDKPDCKIPADIGQREPRGNVPPALLQEWNEKMTRLFLERRANTPSEKPSELPSREEGDAPRSTAAERYSEDENDSESEVTDWSQSPDEHLGPVRDRAPPDSPIRPRILKMKEISEQAATEATQTVDNTTSKCNIPDVPPPTSPPAPITHHITLAPGTDASNSEHNQSSAIPQPPISTSDVPSNNQKPEDENAESSDDDMETSIPQALTTSSQNIASQVKGFESMAQESSNTNSDTSIILDTPAAALRRSTSARVERARNNLLGSITQQGSSDSSKTFSQIIADSIESSENIPAREHEMDFTQRFRIVDSQCTNGDLNDSSLPSHQDSQRKLESSLNSTDLHTQVSVRDEKSTTEQRNDISNASAAGTSGVNLKRKAQELQYHDESPSKRPRPVACRNTRSNCTRSSIHLGRETADEYKDRREIFFNTPEGPQKIFQMFKKHYPVYCGDFNHFSSMCRRLQSVRRGGRLQQFFWWDEFILRHLLEYTAHVNACISSGRDWDSYEDYFCNQLTCPSFKQRFKRRLLEPRMLDIVAPKQISSAKAVVTTDKATQTTIENTVNACVTCQSPLATGMGNKAALGNQPIPSTISDSVLMVDKPTQADNDINLSTSRTATDYQPRMIDTGTRVDVEIFTTPSPQREGYSAPNDDEDMAIEETQQPQASCGDDIEMSEDESVENYNADYRDSASVELGVEPSDNYYYDEEDAEDDYNYRRASLISRMQQENKRAVGVLLNSRIPSPQPVRETETYKARHDYFMKWVENDQNLVSERRQPVWGNGFINQNGSRASVKRPNGRNLPYPAKDLTDFDESTCPSDWLKDDENFASERRQPAPREVSIVRRSLCTSVERNRRRTPSHPAKDPVYSDDSTNRRRATNDRRSAVGRRQPVLGNGVIDKTGSSTSLERRIGEKLSVPVEDVSYFDKSTDFRGSAKSDRKSASSRRSLPWEDLSNTDKNALRFSLAQGTDQRKERRTSTPRLPWNPFQHPSRR